MENKDIKELFKISSNKLVDEYCKSGDTIGIFHDHTRQKNLEDFAEWIQKTYLNQTPVDALQKAIQWCDDKLLKCMPQSPNWYAFNEMKQYLESLQQPVAPLQDNKECVVMIKCPSCDTIQAAVIQRTFPFNTFIHDCVACKYTIMESEWDEVKPFIQQPEKSIMYKGKSE